MQVIITVLLLVPFFAGLFFTVSNATLLWQGIIHGRWFIEGPDFALSILLQWLGGMGVVIAGLGWYTEQLRQLLHRPARPARTQRMLLLIAVVGLLLLFGAHRWFEVIICTRGTVPGECGL